MYYDFVMDTKCILHGLAVLAIAAGCAGTAPRADAVLSFDYRAWNMGAAWDGASDVVLVERVDYKYDSPVSATPSGQTSREVEAALSPERAKALKAALLADADAFFALTDSYGAPEGERYYPYAITLTVGTRSKTVVYRSNPGYPEPPEAWKRIERAILEAIGN